MTTPQAPSEHPLLVAVRVIGEVLDDTASCDPMFVSTGQKRELLVGLTRLVDRLQARRARVLALADDVAAEAGARSSGVWLAAETRTRVREAVAAERVGVALERRWGHTAEAAAAARVSWEQTAVLARSLDSLPDDLDPELVVKAEAHLLAEAGHFGPRELARLGQRVLQVVAPDVADAAEASALAAEERRAQRATRLSFRPRGDGTTDLQARLPDHVASRLRAYLDAYTSPRRGAPFGDVDRLPLSRRRGEAFCALLEHVPADGLPVHGGTATSTPSAPASVWPRPRPARRSQPGRHAAWPARPTCSPSSSAAPERSSTSAAPDVSSHPPSARPWPSATATAAPRAATSRPPGARPTTPRRHGPPAGAPTSPTGSSSARCTTTTPTAPPGTRHASRTVTSATTGGRERYGQ